MLYIMSIIVAFIIISSIFELGSDSSMTDVTIFVILLGMAIVWFIPSGNSSSSNANTDAKAQQEKILNLCRQNPVTKMYEDKGTKYVVINNGVYAVTGEYWGLYNLNEKCK